MISENHILRAKARDQLKGQWAKPILACLIFLIISAVPTQMDNIGGLVNLIITGPFLVGIYLFSLKFVRNQDPEVLEIFYGFKNFVVSLGMYLWYLLWVILWALLLIIPGIIKSLGYMMCFFIIADNPNIGIRNALDISKKIMYGYRGKLFLLFLSFFGWFILCILTLGIGFIWLYPYVQITLANFYEELREDSIARGICSLEDFYAHY